MIELSADHVLSLLRELKAAYGGFVWESALWAEVGGRRSPYRTLVLFGLSARTRDALLVEMCREFFGRYPTQLELTEAACSISGDATGMIRPGQVPFVASIAEALKDGVPRESEKLLQLRGVGEKISECVLAYGWGSDALPLDANCVRVLERVFGLGKPGGPPPVPAPLREGLKCVYLMHSQQFSELAISMVDIHEILRLHGQVCCARTPECSRCPVTGCLSRRESWDESKAIHVSPTIWNDWRELINEPA